METENLLRREMKNSGYMCAMSFFVLVVGIILGSVYLARISVSSGGGIKEYLDSYMNSGVGSDKFGIFKNALGRNTLTMLVIFAAGFFKAGALVTAVVVIKRGFVMGFTAASFVKFYGAKGLLAMASTMPSVVIIIPAFLIFAAVSVRFSFRKEKNQKKFIISYIFFAILVFSIFCAASLAEGYLTTIFMKFVFPKMV